MATFSNSDLGKNSRSLLIESFNDEFKFICKDGNMFENKLRFLDTVLRQSKFWSSPFNCCEVETIFLPNPKRCPYSQEHLMQRNLNLKNSMNMKPLSIITPYF